MKKIGTFYKDIYEIIKENHGEQLKERQVQIQLIQEDDQVKEDIQILISGQYNEKIENQFPNLKLVIVPYTGLNGIDQALAEKNKLVIKNSSAHGKFVAERALALILALLGKIVYYHSNLVQGDWSERMTSNRVDWKSLSHKKVGIFGYGVIGRKLHELIKPFDVKVGVLNYKNRSYDHVEVFNSLESLADWCDVFVIAAPLDDSTKASVNKSILSKLLNKVLINVARGPIIDEDDLYDSLKSNTLGAFASDVWFQYPKKDQKKIMPSKYPLETFDNVVMTPHCGGFEESSLKLRCEDVIHQILNYLE
jgi:phosphoglycerate dehydrogenase-like enzyme